MTGRKLKLMPHVNNLHLACKCHLLSMERSLTNLTCAEYQDSRRSLLLSQSQSRMYKMSRKLYIYPKKKKDFLFESTEIKQFVQSLQRGKNATLRLSCQRCWGFKTRHRHMTWRARGRHGHCDKWSLNRSAPQTNRCEKRHARHAFRAFLIVAETSSLLRLKLNQENVGKEAILKVTDWLRGIWEMRRRAGGPVQQWIDSIPMPTKSDLTNECQEHNPSNKPLTPTEPKNIPLSKGSKLPSMTVSAPIDVPNSSTMNTPILPSSLPHYRLARDASFQSDSSHCSSVESLLELRKADPTAILLDLGFGGCSSSPREADPISRIPKRFLQPSSLQGIAINDFLKQQQESSESFDSVSLGYRGLTGSPYVAPSEIVQKIMERLRENENHEMDANSYNYEYNPLQNPARLSVLSPDNRQFLEQPRSKSPDMRNKRMIIGQKSFAFGCDGNLIEIPSNDTNLTSNDTIDSDNSLLDVSESSIELKQSSLEESITLEHRYFSKNDKKLAKQLSFDDTVDFSDSTDDQLLKDNREIANSLNIAQDGTNVDNKQEDNLFDTTPKCGKYEFLDVRRASDGSYDTSSETKVFEGKRRFSDGVMRPVESQSMECTLMQKRRSLKRQSRVCDTTAMHHCEPIKSSVPNAIFECNISNEEEASNYVTNSTHQLKTLKSFESIEDEDLELKTDTELFREPNYMSSLANISETVDKLKRFESTEENATSSDSCMQDNQTCSKGKICIDCKRGKNCLECCRHVDKRKYWKKMKKIMRENKKLEDMLAKSRREVAEIRGMLSSVLSVRMEPGF